MGGSGSKEPEVRYEYVDTSAEVQQDEYEREKKKLERQRLAKEEHEKNMQKALQMKDKELERKAMFLKDQLDKYRFGFFTNVASFRGLDISDINQIRIGVFGPSGSGKTCFISTAERVIRGTEIGSATPKITGAEGTVILQEYLPETFFHLVDTRGFFQYSTGEMDELENILYGRIRPGEVIIRKLDEKKYESDSSSAPLKDWMHAVIIVVKADDQRLLNESFRSYFTPIREKFRPRGMFPITLVTHADELGTDERREEARKTASAATGSAMDHTFLINNYTPENPERRVETEIQVLELFRFTLLVAEKYIKIAKQQIAFAAKPDMKADVESEREPPCGLVSIDVFMRTLQLKYFWTDNLVQETVQLLKQNDVTTVGILAMCWSDVKGAIRAIVVKDKLEQELIDLNLDVQ